MRIGAAVAAELPLLQDIERAAGEPFRSLGMTTIADDDPALTEGLRAIVRAEAAHGLAARPRVCMRRGLTDAS